MFRGFKCSWSWHCCHSNRCSSCLQLPWKHYGWPSVKTTHYFYVAPVRSGRDQWDRLGQTKQPALEAAVASTLFIYLKSKIIFKHKGQITRNSNPLDFYSEGNLGLIFFLLYLFIIIYLCLLNVWRAKTHKILLPHFRFDRPGLRPYYWSDLLVTAAYPDSTRDSEIPRTKALKWDMKSGLHRRLTFPSSCLRCLKISHCLSEHSSVLLPRLRNEFTQWSSVKTSHYNKLLLRD